MATPQWFADPDADGRSNLIEYALGSSPFSADTPTPLRTTFNGAALTIELDAIQAAPDVEISAESSTDLINWQPTSRARTPMNPLVSPRPLPKPAPTSTAFASISLSSRSR